MIVQRGIDAGRLLRAIGPGLAGLLAYDVLVTAAYVYGGLRWISVPELPLPLLGSAIAVILTLRNNAAYARWWEARTLWGAVVNNSRSLRRGLIALCTDAKLRDDMTRQQIAYVLALRCHLLGLKPAEAIGQYLPAETTTSVTTAKNVPAAIQFAMARDLAESRKAGSVDAMGATALNATLGDLANAQGGLERIKNTPLPRQFSHLPQVFTRIYCILLPIGLVGDLGISTPIGSTVIGFLFLALDRIGADLEDPFGSDVHDIPMEAITRIVEIDLLQSLGANDVPDPIAPRNGILP